MGGVDNLISKLKDWCVVAQTRNYTVISPQIIWGPENYLFWIIQPVVTSTCHRILVLWYFVEEAKEDV